MGLNRVLLFFAILLPSHLSLSSSSRIFSSDTSEFATSLLDVSALLEQTHQVLSFNPEKFQPSHQEEKEQTLTPPTSSSSSFSLRLHPRDTVLNAQHQNYKSLVLARLDRDSARVKSLTTKLQVALNHINMSDLRPTETELQPEALSTPVSSGISQGTGEYLTRVGVGQPGQQFYMALDTGSDVNWLQCNPCEDCYQQSDPVFDPSTSSSYSPLTCNSKECSALYMSDCRNDKCRYQVSYGDGSFTVGDYITETLSFGNSGSVNGVAMGCGHDNEGLFFGAAGLLGLGGGSPSLTSQIKASSFSYCLVDRDSSKSSTLDFNSAPPGNSVTASLLRNPNPKLNTFYYVQLTGFSVGGQMVPLPPSTFALDGSGRGGIIVDSGTSITRLQTQAYNSLRDAFKSLTQNLRSTAGVALFDTCYDFSSLKSVMVPTVSFHFSGGKSLTLPAKNYLIPLDSTGTFCFAFAPSSSSLSIIGNVQQQGTRVSFDLANSLVGFSPNNC